MLERIVSGGQSGVDRAALDWAIAHGIPHGGWCPPGRLAEDGPLAACYLLREIEVGSYRQRTRRNVEDSDGTLILNLGELEGGTLATRRFAERLKKPSLVVGLDHGIDAGVAARIAAWLADQDIRSLNVAGPRESKRPGIYRLAMELMSAVLSPTSDIR